MNRDNKAKCIGIYGGSFNPIHNGHIQLAKHILQLAKLDEIWMMVSPQNPLKPQHDLLNDQLRLQMVQAALQNEPHLIACDYEFYLPKPSYTWNTLQSLSKQYPEILFSLIIGADNWHVFNRWAHYKDILQQYEIIIYPRQNYPIIAKTLPPYVQLVDTPLYNISSTEIRNRIQQGKKIEHLIPTEILADALKYYAL